MPQGTSRPQGRPRPLFAASVLLLVGASLAVAGGASGRPDESSLLGTSRKRRMHGAPADATAQADVQGAAARRLRGTGSVASDETQVAASSPLRAARAQIHRRRKQRIHTIVYSKAPPRKWASLPADQLKAVDGGDISQLGLRSADQRPSRRRTRGRRASKGRRTQQKAAKLVLSGTAQSRLEEKRLARSSAAKGHELTPELQRSCSAADYSDSTFLSSTEGLHLLYPETWNAVDFIYHQNYGSGGQVRIPVLMNMHTDEMLRDVFETLPTDSGFLARHNISSCAVVDSTSAIRGAGHGQAIDQHGVVFRYGKPLAGQGGREAGVRTTFRVLTRSGVEGILHEGRGREFPYLRSLESDVTLLLFNSKARTDEELRPWLALYRKLLAGLEETKRTDVSVVLMSPLAYTGAKMLTLDVAKCLQAGGADVSCPLPAPTSKMSTVVAAVHLCDTVTAYGDFSNAKLTSDLPRSCSDVQRITLRTLAVNAKITSCGQHGCSSGSR